MFVIYAIPDTTMLPPPYPVVNRFNISAAQCNLLQRVYHVFSLECEKETKYIC